MKKTLIGLFLVAAAPAVAADFPTKAPYMPVASPIYNWTGLYIGANAGGGWSNDCWTQRGANVPLVPLGNIIKPLGGTSIGLSGGDNVSEGCNNATGAVVGGQIGYRYEINSIVVGIEAQGDWANLSGSNASTALSGLNALTNPFGVTSTLTNQNKVDAIGMFTGQVGYSFGPVLWYVKGGAAVTDNSYNGTLNINFPATSKIGTLTATDHGTDVKFGGVVGTGAEWRFAPNWSVGVEYNHLFMGSQQVGLAYTGGNSIANGFAIGNPGAPSRNESISQDIDMATVKLNYQINWH